MIYARWKRDMNSRRLAFSSRIARATSTDTSTAGEDGFNPLSYFSNIADMRQLFHGLDGFEFYTTNPRGYPFRFLHHFIEKHWGFFLQVTAHKPPREAAPDPGSTQGMLAST
ncbi:MAG: hypothetical protein CL938_02615 [Deltaproteobacteria bacterium]|nr:hypothetical protein [Deltaproteobacteria bacterium]